MAIAPALWNKIKNVFKNESAETALPPKSLAWSSGFRGVANPALGIPKENSGVSFNTLRRISYLDPIVRNCINIIKKEVSQSQWRIVKDPLASTLDKGELEDAVHFFRYLNIDGENLRMLLDRTVEDLLALDAAVWELLPNAKGEIVGLNSVDGATIRIKINDKGEQLSYVQIIEGVLVTEFTADELVYMMANPQNNVHRYPYGMSPIEGIMLNIQSSLNADLFNANAFQADNVPSGILNLGNVHEHEAQSIVDMWNAQVIGNNQGLKFMYGSEKIDFLDFKKSNRDMQYIQYLDRLTRITLAAFGLSAIDLNIIQDVNRSCYDEETETLTENGFKKYWEIEKGEKIATFNPETQRIEYHVPNSFHLYDIEEEINYIKNKFVDIAVTDDHDMWVKEVRQENYQKIKVQDIPWAKYHFLDRALLEDISDKDIFTLPKVEKLSWKHLGNKEKKLNMDVFLEFLGYFISEGGLSVKEFYNTKRYHFTLVQKEGPVAERMKEVLSMLGFSHDYKVQKDGCVHFNVYGKQIVTWLIENCGEYSNNKQLPKEMLFLSKRQAGILFNALMEGGGHWNTDPGCTGGYYSTTSKYLADQMQILAYQLGYRASVTLHYKGEERGVNCLDCYRVSISNPHASAYQVHKNDVERKMYKGKVYCFNVPNHLFVTRRNGKITIQGNTSQAQTKLSNARGVQTVKHLIQETFNTRLLTPMGYKTIMFEFTPNADLNEQKLQAEIDKIYTTETGIMSIKEVREREGFDILYGENDMDDMEEEHDEEEATEKSTVSYPPLYL